MSKTALYRHFDLDGALLYVGISASPLVRTDTHTSEAPWANEVAKVTIEWFPSRAAALNAETAAICAEQPAHNISNTLRHKARPVREFLAPWGNLANLARDINCGETTVRAWFNRGSIPAKYDDAIMASAARNGRSITPIELHQLRRSLARAAKGAAA